jgi:hypothetical protein
MHVNGFIIERVDANRTKITNVSDVDPKGSIPGFVVNAMAGKRAEIMASLEQRINQK